jgi:hypothetical protein
MNKQRGVTLTGLIVFCAIVGFFGLMAAKLFPSYLEYWSVRKMLRAMEDSGETRGSPVQIRKAYDIRNAIEDARDVQSRDLQINNQGGQTVVSAEWSVKVPMISNISACLDFFASSSPDSASSDSDSDSSQ